MKLTTVVAATAVFSTANALYIPNDHVRRYPSQSDEDAYPVKSSQFVPLRAMLPTGVRPTQMPRPDPEKMLFETKTLPEHITPPKDKKNEPVPYVKGCASAQYESEKSDHCVHYSHIEVHKAVPRSLEKRQKGPDPDKVDEKEEDANTPLLDPLLDQVAQRYKPLIPKKLFKGNDDGVKKNESVAIYPKNQPKQDKHELLEGLIDKNGQRNKGSDESGAKDQGKETTDRKDCDKERDEELLEDVIDKVEKRVKHQTPQFTKKKGKVIESTDEDLLEDVMEEVEDRVKPQIPREKGEVADDDDEMLEDLLEQAELQHKTRARRWLEPHKRKRGRIERRLKRKYNKRRREIKGLRGYSPEYLAGLVRLEGDELCRKHPKNCIKAKSPWRTFTRDTLEAQARLEDMKKYAMMHTSPEDFRSFRYITDEEAAKSPELEVWIDGGRGVVYRGKMDPEEEERYDSAVEELGVRRAGYRDGLDHVATNMAGILFDVSSGPGPTSSRMVLIPQKVKLRNAMQQG
ncbi:hypothetical protein N0V84_005095 [Fusarium piperis]|uniref:Uncharacterized protein n=1 Tax=Fusarium piperis TaxID=1435070 RepID=A0A9W8WEM8_9HYPO|nr:hypothetical protein N0V84_005095 [Fusarium piperis]